MLIVFPAWSSVKLTTQKFRAIPGQIVTCFEDYGKGTPLIYCLTMLRDKGATGSNLGPIRASAGKEVTVTWRLIRYALRIQTQLNPKSRGPALNWLQPGISVSAPYFSAKSQCMDVWNKR
jgi:hypothetical protein